VFDNMKLDAPKLVIVIIMYHLKNYLLLPSLPISDRRISVLKNINLTWWFSSVGTHHDIGSIEL